MAFHPPGYWRRAADPALTPAAALADLEPDNLAAYYRLCGRPDLPDVLVDRMVRGTLRDRSDVTASSKALHLLSRHSLPPEHLISLAAGLSEHEYNDRPRARVLTHPRAGRGVLAALCWTFATTDPTDRGPAGPKMRTLLEAHNPGTRTGIALGDALRANRAVPQLDSRSFSLLLRRLWLADDDAAAVAARLAPTWTSSVVDLAAAATAIARKEKGTAA